VLLAACSGKDNGSAKDKPAPPPSPFAAIANGKIDVEGGIIEVAARRGGVIRDVYVQEGAVVRKGQVLARQEDDDALLAVASARAAVAQAQSQAALLDVNLATAQRELERLQRLEPSNLVARQQVDQASDALAVARAQRVAQQAAVATTEAQLAQARYSADLTIIRAPMNGKIIRRYANPGAGASTLQVSKMFDLEPDAARIVRAEITESSIPAVRVGQEAEIVPEADETIVQAGKVIRMAATFGARKLSSDAAGEAADERVVEVVVSADKAPFLIGQRVLVKFMKPGERAGAQREPAARKP
jgi:HlyD family secretion protein